ncbi:MAG: glycosyltransferase family 39 protein [Candidatus Blackburnbacteria bacterium]|nr:glycosyltransferase family 39 protein [Candidatus Blackburnbacteria bacterium]
MEKGLLAIIGIYTLLILLMLPLREVGYHMDFAYHHAVGDFLESGILKNHTAVVPSFILQEVWGALFSYLLGFSYKTLHISVIVLFFFGIVAFYKALRELNLSEVRSVVFTTTLLVFPHLLRFIFTFMTNIPHLSLQLVSLLFGIWAIKRNSWRYAFSSSAFGMLAFLIRNFSIVFPISLFIVFAIKSYYDKKFYFKHLLAIAIPALFITSAYYYWLIVGDNITSGQYHFVYNNLEETKRHLFPPNLRAVATYYHSYIGYYYRVSLFVLLLFTILLPLVMMFKIPKLDTIKRNKGFLLRTFFIGSVLFALIYIKLIADHGIRLEGAYWRVYLPLIGPISWGHALYRYVSDNIYYDVNNWARAILLFLSYATLPLAIFAGGVMIYKTHLMFFEFKKIRNFFNNKLFIGILVIAGLIFRKQLVELLYVYHESARDAFGFWVFWTIILAVFIHTFVFRPRKKLISPDAFFTLFFSLSLVFQLFMLMIYDTGLDFEYMFPLFPLAILIFAIVFREAPLSPIRATIITIVLVVIGLHWARRDYQIPGIFWEKSVQIINNGIVEPRNVEQFTWAWLPYFYYEDGYKLELAKRGGDRKKVLLHTWREVPHLDPDLNKPFLVHQECRKVNWSEGDPKIIDRTYERSLFINTEFCHIMKN